jgi:hypothetical protein
MASKIAGKDDNDSSEHRHGYGLDLIFSVFAKTYLKGKELAGDQHRIFGAFQL